MMDVNEVKKCLPHRYPFLLIDRVVEVDAGKRIHAYKNVTVNEPHFNGHFPHAPIMPGVLITEAVAQAAGVLGLVSTNRSSDDGYTYLLVGTDKARFKRMVIPGDRLDLYAEIITIKRHLIKFSCEGRVDGQLVASAELLVSEQKVNG